MSTRYWQGGAPAVAQIDTVQITAYDAATTYTITIGGIAISTVGDTDANTTATNLTTALNASTHPYFAAITWSSATDTVTATADTAGVPFVAASSVTGGTGTIGAVASSTAMSGPNDFDTAENWSGQTVPASSDTVIWSDNAIPCVWGMDQSALTTCILYVDQTYTGAIGLDRRGFATSADGATRDTTAPEYRAHTLDIGIHATTYSEIGRKLTAQAGSGSSRIKISDAGTNGRFLVHSTGSSVGPHSCLLLPAGSSSIVEIRDGSVGIGVDVPGETATAGWIKLSGSAPSAVVSVGAGVTLTYLFQDEGTLTLRAAGNITQVDQRGGTVTVEGSAYDLVTVNSYAGTMNITGQVDITNLNMRGGNIDASGTDQGCVMGTISWIDGGSITFDPQVTVSSMAMSTPKGVLTHTR